MDVVTAFMFVVMAIVLEHILVEFAQDVQDYFSRPRKKDFWKWE